VWYRSGLTTGENVKRIVVIGAGITGLAAAYALHQAKSEGQDVEWLLLEREDRVGGKIHTERTGGFVIDGGPDCFLPEKPWVGQLAAALGIDGDMLPTNDEHKKTFILSGGKLHLLPDGVMGLVPTKFVPFATSGLFSWPGKLRMAADLVIPKRQDDGDETLASFVRRRLGQEALDKLAEPLIGGIHASDPEQMSLKATFPRFLDMEQKSGSLIRHMLKARKKMPAPPPPKPGRPKRTFFMSFVQGMSELTDSCAARLDPERVLTGVAVTGIEREGDGYLVKVAGRDPIKGSAVIVATEAHAAASLVEPIDSTMSEALASIPHVSSATVSLAYKKDEAGHDLDGFGFIVPSVEHRKIMASTWTSTKWSHRVPEGYVMLRAFVGGAHNQELADLGEAEMTQMVRAELKDLMGIVAKPDLVRIFRWPKGMPQYTLGHLERVAKIESRAAGHAGLLIAGGAYHGVGIGDCINAGQKAAADAVAATCSVAS